MSKIACSFATKIVPTAIFFPIIVANDSSTAGSVMPCRLYLSAPPPSLVGRFALNGSIEPSRNCHQKQLDSGKDLGKFEHCRSQQKPAQNSIVFLQKRSKDFIDIARILDESPSTTSTEHAVPAEPSLKQNLHPQNTSKQYEVTTPQH